MMRRIVMSSKFVCALFMIGGGCAWSAAAQPPAPSALPQPAPDKLFILENVAPLPTFGASIDIIRSEGAVPGPHITGKPYSARAITESTRTLADGNRITQHNETVIYRDSAGRTRREQILSGVGQWHAEQPVTLIDIHDPVADKSYVLDPAARTAREIRRFQMAFAHAQTVDLGNGDVGASYATAPAGALPPPLPAGSSVTVIRGDGREDVQVFTPAAAGTFAVAPFPEGTTGMYEPAEDLGEQVLEGLLVEGSRMTDTIPAGVIGNERPIEIVTERWYSKDIDAMVLQRFSDPRVGETTYRLVNVVLGEPSPDLFQVPQGYEIEASEPPRAGVRVLTDKAIELEKLLGPPPAP
jgi:hypothetical protein